MPPPPPPPLPARSDADVTAALVGFFLGRSFVSSAFALANQAMPDLTPALGGASKAWVARMDAVNALLGFATRPLWGAFVDSFGRKPALVVGCAGAGLARLVYASDPTSAARYVAYRMLNFTSNIPIMQASIALLADACGGRSSPLYTKINRRMWMWLAVVRIAVVWAAGRMAEAESDPDEGADGAREAAPPGLLPLTDRGALPSASEAARPAGDPRRQRKPAETAQERHRRVGASQLAGAGAASLLAAAAFAALTSETLGERRAFGSPLDVWRRSLLYFTRSRERAALVPVVLLQAMPMYAGSAMTNLCRETFAWGPAERARYTLVENASEILVPLVASELTTAAPKSMRLALRVSALIALNTALTPSGLTLLANPVLGRLVEGGPEYNRALVAAQRSYHGADEGEGTLEAALTTLEFPAGFLLPNAFLQLSIATGSPRSVFGVVAVSTLLASEWAWPRAEGILGLRPAAGAASVASAPAQTKS